MLCCMPKCPEIDAFFYVTRLVNEVIIVIMGSVVALYVQVLASEGTESLTIGGCFAACWKYPEMYAFIYDARLVNGLVGASISF